MHFKSLIFAIPALAGAVTAAPAGQHGTISLSLTQGSATNSQSSDSKSLSNALALGRYSQYHAEQGLATTASNISVKVPLKNFMNYNYFMPVSIGTQNFTVVLATGQSDLFVYSTLEPKADQLSNLTIYKPGLSAKKQKGLYFNTTFSDGGNAAGVVYTDKVSVGTATATGVDVLACTSLAYWQNDFQVPVDGILGLAFRKGSAIAPLSKAKPTFFETIAPSLARPLFTLSLPYNKTGALDFGFVDQSKYSGDISWTPLNKNGTKYGTWEINAGHFLVSGKQSEGKLGDTIVDTSSDLILVQPFVMKRYLQGVKGVTYNETEGGYFAPCSCKAPAFAVQFGGNVTIHVPGKAMLEPITPTLCMFNMQPIDIYGAPVNVLGVKFLQRAFSVFADSKTGARVGFATPK